MPDPEDADEDREASKPVSQPLLSLDSWAVALALLLALLVGIGLIKSVPW